MNMEVGRYRGYTFRVWPNPAGCDSSWGWDVKCATWPSGIEKTRNKAVKRARAYIKKITDERRHFQKGENDGKVAETATGRS